MKRVNQKTARVWYHWSRKKQTILWRHQWQQFSFLSFWLRAEFAVLFSKLGELAQKQRMFFFFSLKLWMKRQCLLNSFFSEKRGVLLVVSMLFLKLGEHKETNCAGVVKTE